MEKTIITHSLTNPEIMRVIDLALRRMTDNGIDGYGTKDQTLYKKIQDIKQQYGKRYGSLL